VARASVSSGLSVCKPRDLFDQTDVGKLVS